MVMWTPPNSNIEIQLDSQNKCIKLRYTRSSAAKLPVSRELVWCLKADAVIYFIFRFADA